MYNEKKLPLYHRQSIYPHWPQKLPAKQTAASIQLPQQIYHPLDLLLATA